MTEPSSAAEAPIEAGDSLLPEENTDTSDAPVFGPDELDDFRSCDNQGWPDKRLKDGKEVGDFEAAAFPPQPKGVS
jgi:hypothetical protein